MRGTVAVVVLLVSLVRNGDPLGYGGATGSDRVQMLLLQTGRKDIQSFQTALQAYLVFVGQGTDIGQLQSLVQEATESRLGVPVVERYRQVQIGMLLNPLVKELFAHAQLAVVQVGHTLLLLIAPPDPQQVLSPFVGRRLLPGAFAVLELQARRHETLFELLQIDRLP